MKISSSQEGLTLLEILVAITILSIILGVIYSSFFSATKSAKFLESDEDVYQTARSLTGMLSQELRALYYYQDPVTKKGVGLTGVDSEVAGHPADAIYFLTSSHRRTDENAREGNVAEIGYFFDVDEMNDKKRLIKSEDPTVDLDFQKGGALYVLTDRVEEMNITYYKKQTDEWENSWDMSTQNGIPDLIKIDLRILDDEDQSIHFETVIKPSVQ
jgi:general secretion pathway protein J